MRQEPPDPTFCRERFIAARVARGWSARDLSKASRVAESQISKYEKGVTQPSLSVCVRLAAALGVTVEYLVKTHYADMPPKRALAHTSLDGFQRNVPDTTALPTLRRIADENHDPPQSVREWASHLRSLEIGRALATPATRLPTRAGRPGERRRLSSRA